MKSPRSAKAKGRRLQNLVRDALRIAFPSLHRDDIKSQTMGMPGEDIIFSPAAREQIPFCFECKNKERMDLWKSLQQAEDNTKEGFSPVLIIKRNFSNTYAVIPFDKFMEMISGK